MIKGIKLFNEMKVADDTRLAIDKELTFITEKRGTICKFKIDNESNKSSFSFYERNLSIDETKELIVYLQNLLEEID